MHTLSLLVGKAVGNVGRHDDCWFDDRKVVVVVKSWVMLEGKVYLKASDLCLLIPSSYRYRCHMSSLIVPSLLIK